MIHAKEGSEPVEKSGLTRLIGLSRPLGRLKFLLPIYHDLGELFRILLLDRLELILFWSYLLQIIIE